MDNTRECYAVIFSSVKGEDTEGYDEMAMEMVSLAMQQKGFLDVEHVQMGDSAITISYWDSEEAILNWKNNSRHKIAQEKGKAGWYKNYSLKIAKVTREYRFGD